MTRRTALLVAALALVAVVGIAAAAPVGTVVAQDDPGATEETSDANETAEPTANATDISPGESLAGVIGVQRAEVAGEVDSRAFEVALNRSSSPAERADLVAERVNRTAERLAGLEAKQQELRRMRADGELTAGSFAARMAATGARAEAIKREANRSAEVAEALPESVRAERGLNPERLDDLRERAGNASGPEVAAIARGVAGDDVGGPLAGERRGPPDGTADNQTARGDGTAGEGRPDPGERPGDGRPSGSDAGSTPGSGGPGAGPAERETSTSANATVEGDGATPGNDASRAGRSSGASENATENRGSADGDDGGTDADATGGQGPGSSAGTTGSSDERGANAGANGNGNNAIGFVSDSLVEPLFDGLDAVGHAVAGLDG